MKGPTNLLGVPALAERRELPEPRFSVLPRVLGGELRRTGHTKCSGGAGTGSSEAEGFPSAKSSVLGREDAAGVAEDFSSAGSATCLALLEAFRAGRGSGDPHGDGVLHVLSGLLEAILWYLGMHT